MPSNYLQRVVAAASRTTSEVKPPRSARPLVPRAITPFATPDREAPDSEPLRDSVLGSQATTVFPAIAHPLPPAETDHMFTAPSSCAAEKTDNLSEPVSQPASPSSTPPAEISPAAASPVSQRAAFSLFAKSATRVQAPPGLRPSGMKPSSAPPALPSTVPVLAPQVAEATSAPQVPALSPLLAHESSPHTRESSRPAPVRLPLLRTTPRSTTGEPEPSSHAEVSPTHQAVPAEPITEAVRLPETKALERSQKITSRDAVQPSSREAERVARVVGAKSASPDSATVVAAPVSIGRGRRDHRINIGQIEVHVNNQVGPRKRVDSRAAGSSSDFRFHDVQQLDLFFLKP